MGPQSNSSGWRLVFATLAPLLANSNAVAHFDAGPAPVAVFALMQRPAELARHWRPQRS